MKKDKMKNIISSIASEILILFVPKLLSPLHLASYYSYKKGIEREKRLNKLSKKMLVIANRYTKAEEMILLNDISRVELFYMVYNQMDHLELRELKILRDFCCALNNPYDLTIVREGEPEREDDIYYKYKNVLDDTIESNIKGKAKVFR